MIMKAKVAKLLWRGDQSWTRHTLAYLNIELYKNSKIEIHSVHQILTIGTADIENAHLLEIAIDAPILNIRRYVLNKNVDILYFADNIYPAEIAKIEMNMKK